VDVLRVEGSLWVQDSCHQAVLVPTIDSQVPVNELHLNLSSSADQQPPNTACVPVVNKSIASYESDSSIDGVTEVVVRHPLRRLTLELER